MVLCLTLPDGHPGEVSPLLLAGSGPPLLATAAEVVSGLGTLQPLTRELYVDFATPGTLAQQNGSIAFPFATAQQAVDALALIGGGTVLLAPGTYNEIVSLVGAPGLPMDFVNVGSTPVLLTTISLNGGLVTLRGITITNISIGPATAPVRIQDCTVTGILTCQDITINNCTLGGTLTCRAVTALISTFNAAVAASGVLTLRASVFALGVASTAAAGTHRLDNSRFVGTFTGNSGAAMVARDCAFTGTAAFGAADLNGCVFSGDAFFQGALTSRFCTFLAQCQVTGGALLSMTRLSSITQISGLLQTDFLSIASVLPVLSYGSISMQPVACRITLSVAVPVVAAGAVAYLNVSLVGTDLEGMLTAASAIIVNPQSDLVAAGAGGGFLNARFTAANSLRMAFVGPIAAAAHNFSVALI